VFKADLTDQRFEGRVASVAVDKGFFLIECAELPDLVPQGTEVFALVGGQERSFRTGDVVCFGIVVHEQGLVQARGVTLLSAFKVEHDLRGPMWERLNRLAHRALAVASGRDFTLVEISGLVWSCATLSYNDPPLLAAIASAAIPSKTSDFRPNRLDIIAWAVARLPFRDAPLLDSISESAITQLSELPHEFTFHNLSNLAWALSTLKFPHPPLLSHAQPGSAQASPKGDQ